MRDKIIESLLESGGIEELIELCGIDIHELVYEAAQQKLKAMSDEELLEIIL